MSNTSLLGSYGDNSGAGLMFRNRLINASAFDIWQRGTSFSSLATYTYTADRWLTDGAVTTVARTGTQNNVMQVVTQAGTGIAQRVETNGGNFLAGQTYTLSGSINASVADLTVTITYRAGNTFKSTIHTATVSSQLTAGAYSKFTTTFTLANAPTDFAGTDCIQVSLTSSVVNTLNIASVQLEAGPVATPFERRPIGMELALCQRYYEKSYDLGVAPGSNSGVGLSIATVGDSVSLNRLMPNTSCFAVPKLKNPTVTTYSETGTKDRVSVYSNSASLLTVSSIATNGNTRFGFIQTSTNAVDRQMYYFHWTAEAEL